MSLAMILLTSTSYAQFALETNVASIQDETYRVSFESKIELPEEILEAVSSGVPIRLRLDIESVKERFLMLDKNLEKTSIYFELIYRPLARIFQVRQSGQMAVTVRELDSGLEQLIDDFVYEMDWSQEIDVIRVRLGIDVDSLPGPMQLTAWIKPIWRSSTGWMRWHR